MSATKDNNMNSGQMEASFEEDEFSARRFMLDDLQLAAELGKTLLERNKELETALRQHQNVIEDQTQEIEYLTKQTVALREVNDSRLRIYEQLEISIQDLERANHRLALDHTADKKHIKSLCANIEVLEAKSEELQRAVDDLTAQLDMCKRKAERQLESKISQDRLTASSPIAETPKKTGTDKIQLSPTKTSSPILANSECVRQVEQTAEQEEMLRLNDEVRENKIAFAQEHRRVTELEEQLASMVQENNRLQSQLRDLHSTNDEPKSMHEEFSFLEEVRQGQLCIRCLRGANDRAADEMSSCMDDDDRSNISSMLLPPPPSVPAAAAPASHTPHHIQDEKELWTHKPISSNDNPYRDLVEKYEALLEVQMSQPNNRKSKPSPAANTSAPLSLQDDLHTSGDYSAFSVKDTDDESAHGESKVPPKPNPEGRRKKITQTPDFSEAETSSSGFSDETSNKGTQTERERPGSFLCTIADGEDYRFSIYDDGTSVDNRFRNRPEYKELFKEIFTILKKAAENKDEGEKLPLLDDSAPPALSVPPVTPATENTPGSFTDDTQSIMSSAMSEQSIPFSDVVIAEPAVPPAVNVKESTDLNVESEAATVSTPIPITISRPIRQDKKEEDKDGDKIRASSQAKPITEAHRQAQGHEEAQRQAQNGTPQRVLTPLVRQPLEYIAASTHLRKKSSSKHRNRKHSTERSGADSPVIPSPPKVTYQKSGRKRRDYRPLESSPLAKLATTPANFTEAADWNGSTMQFYNRSINSPTPSATSAAGGTSTRGGRTYKSWNPDTDSWDMKQCTASQEINKLRRLELSYAEVLRNADKAKPTRQARRKHQ